MKTFIQTISIIVFSVIIGQLVSAGEAEYHIYKEREWFKVMEVTNIYESPSLSSKVVGSLDPEYAGILIKSNVKTYPGKVLVKSSKLAKKYGIDMKEPILYFGSLGESLQPELQLKGQERKLFDESFESHECKRDKYKQDVERCWLEVIEEPIVRGWSMIKYGQDNRIGWVYTDILVNDIPQEPGFD